MGSDAEMQQDDYATIGLGGLYESHQTADLTAEIASLAAPLPGSVLFDLGCGAGRHSLQIVKVVPGARGFGLDRRPGLVMALQRAAHGIGVADRVCGFTGDFETLATTSKYDEWVGSALPAEKSADVILCLFAICYVEDRNWLYKIVNRFGMMGARFVVTGYDDSANAEMHSMWFEATDGRDLPVTETTPYNDVYALRDEMDVAVGFDGYKLFENSLVFADVDLFMRYYRSTTLRQEGLRICSYLDEAMRDVATRRLAEIGQLKITKNVQIMVCKVR